MLLFFITYNLKQLHGHLINILKVTFKGFVVTTKQKRQKSHFDNTTIGLH